MNVALYFKTQQALFPTGKYNRKPSWSKAAGYRINMRKRMGEEAWKAMIKREIEWAATLEFSDLSQSSQRALNKGIYDTSKKQDNE